MIYILHMLRNIGLILHCAIYSAKICNNAVIPLPTHNSHGLFDNSVRARLRVYTWEGITWEGIAMGRIKT